MRLILKIKPTLLILVLTLCWCNPFVNEIYGQEKEAKTVKKAQGAAKKDLKTIEKILSFKKFFHHSDSSRLAKRYIRWHKKLTKGKGDYRFTISKDDLKDSIPWERKNDNDLTKEIFGWYPYWDKELYKSLDYSLLSTIAYFSYQVNPQTGDTITTNGWNTDPSIDYILAEDKKVLLTITNFGNSENKQFLKNAEAGDLLIERALELIKARKAHGVCIDFEGILKSQKNNFNSFIVQFSQELRKANKDYKLYLTVPAVDWNKYLDYDELIPVVDQFVIMGYNYYGKTSKVAGPTAPLNSGKIWDPFNLTTSVNYYLANQVPNEKLILALPFYGNCWNTETGNKGAKVDKYIGARTYDYIKNEMKKVPEITAQYDSVSESNWYSYVLKERDKKNKRQYRQIWFDSDSTMATKMELVHKKKLNGLGIWALGYDKKYDDYWKVIEEVFCKSSLPGPHDSIIRYPDSLVIVFKDSTNAVAPIQTTSDSAKKNSPAEDGPTLLEKFWNNLKDINGIFEQLNDFKKLLLFALLFVVFFGGIGFIISMFKPETRLYLFSSKALTIYYTSFVLLFLLAAILSWNKKVFDQSILLIFGFIVGAIAMYLISKIIQKRYSNLP